MAKRLPKAKASTPVEAIRHKDTRGDKAARVTAAKGTIRAAIEGGVAKSRI